MCMYVWLYQLIFLPKNEKTTSKTCLSIMKKFNTTVMQTEPPNKMKGGTSQEGYALTR